MINHVLLDALVIAAVAAGPRADVVQRVADQAGLTKVHYRSHGALVRSRSHSGDFRR